jgi:hypothetical protein
VLTNISEDQVSPKIHSQAGVSKNISLKLHSNKGFGKNVKVDIFAHTMFLETFALESKFREIVLTTLET